MKRISIVILCVLLVTTANIYSQALTAADYDHAVKMLGANTTKYVDRNPMQMTFLPDGKFWYMVLTPTGRQFVLVDPATGAKQTGDNPAQIGIPARQPGGAGRFGGGGTVSPDGKKEVFIKDWNLWVRDIATKAETQLTKDGVKDYGYATDNAGWRKSDRAVVLWSPDSKKIATYRQDQRHVSEMYLVSTSVGAPQLQQWKYPLPQDKEVIKIERIIIDVDAAKITPLKIPADDRRATLCDDISCSGAFDDNEWSPDSTMLAFVSSSRDHQEAKFRIATVATGDVREVYEEKSATQYESGGDSISWRYFPKTNEFIWYSARDDWGHLYLYDLRTGQLKNQITKGNFVVTRVHKFDEQNRKIYFEAKGREAGRDPYFSHFYSVGFDGKDLKLLTPDDGNHQVTMSPDGKYLIDTFSKPDVPQVTVLRDINGKQIVELEKTDISRLTATGWKAPTPIKVRSANNKWDLYGLMFTPTNLDSTKKYPVINYIYPGPTGGGVGSRSFSAARSDHQAIAELGFVVIIIDGSCNPDRSKSFHDACYGDMAENSLSDQIAGIKELAAKHSYIDATRVGVWGHSGGGFATAAAMFKHPDFYKVGVSQAGNHDNRNYEDDWGERYIGLLVKDAAGKDNYENQANQTFAKNLKGKLMLAHGNMDDNVPPYNTYLVVDALIKANKDFDLIIYPHARHGFGADNNYMTRRRWDYFVKHLMGAETPKEYQIVTQPDTRMSQR